MREDNPFEKLRKVEALIRSPEFVALMAEFGAVMSEGGRVCDKVSAILNTDASISHVMPLLERFQVLHGRLAEMVSDSAELRKKFEEL